MLLKNLLSIFFRRKDSLMKKGTKVWVFLFFFLLLLSLWLIIGILKVYGDVPDFNEFERWFGPAPKGNERTKQLFDATKLLLVEMDKNPRNLQAAAETIRCKLTPDQWQDVLNVAFSYRIWQEIVQVRNEIAKQKPPGLTKDEMVLEINRLELSLKAELQKILDGQAKADVKLDEILKGLGNLAKKLDSQSIQLKEISEKLDRLLQDQIQPKGISQEEVDRLNEEIANLKAEIERLKKELANQPQSEPVWPEEEKGPGNFWAGVGLIEQKRIYGNPFGFVGDSVALHSWPLQATFIEVGARKFLLQEIGAVQVFAGGGLHKTYFIGFGALAYIKPLDISLGVGVMYFSENLAGEIEPVKGFGEITFEGKWVRGNARVVPALQLFTLGIDVKF